MRSAALVRYSYPNIQICESCAENCSESGLNRWHLLRSSVYDTARPPKPVGVVQLSLPRHRHL